MFDIQPLVHPTAAATEPPFLPPESTHPSMDPLLDLSVHSHPPTVQSASCSSNGGVLYDMSYTPDPNLSLSSPDQDSSLFAPTSDWWAGVTDQFAMGGSASMTRTASG